MNTYDPKNINILIVDDKLSNLQTLMKILVNRGYKVRPAINGMLALEAIQKVRPDLILLDIRMPDMSGYEVCNRLKEDEETSDIPVIFISALDEIDDKVRAFEIGGIDYITKPFHVEEVLVRIETHLSLRILHKRLLEETEKRKEQEKLLIQKSKLAAMGEMIVAIAHQWRQPLNAVNVILFDILDAYNHDELDYRYIDEAVYKAKQQIVYMSKTIDDFRNFFKYDREKEKCDAKVVVGEALSLYSARFDVDNISYKLICHTHNKIFNSISEVIPCESMTINMFKGEYKQVIMNTISNALESIKAKKECNSQYKDGLILFDFYNNKDENKLIINISDNGIGINDEIKNRIFEPYFTTKFQSQGTGIGLYMSKLIVEKHMGGKFHSIGDGDGATFSIELPVDL